MKDNRNKLLEAIIKRADRGEYGLDPLIGRTDDFVNDAMRARSVQEDALGKLALEQYKGKVPNKVDNDFLEGLREQFLPDVKSKLQVEDDLPGAHGLYTPKKDLIQVAGRSPEKATGTFIHEGLHARDLKSGDYGDLYDLKSGPTTNKRLQGLAPELFTETAQVKDPKALKKIIQSTDIEDIKELLLMGHHGLGRVSTAARANLPRLLKGLGLLSTGAISLGAEAADSEDEGSAPEEMQMQRESDQAKFDEAVNKLNPGAAEQIKNLPPIKAQDLLKEQETGPKLKKLSKLITR